MAKHAANHSVRRALVLALAAAALLALPQSANASFANLDSLGKLTYTAVPGEANDLTATYTSAGVVKLTEAGHFGPLPILIGGSGSCSGIGALLTCKGATSLDLRTGDGNDKVAARNGSADKISCGSGTDAVAADPQDSVAPDCESVDRGTTNVASPGNGTDGSGSAGGPPSPPVDAGRSSLGEPSPFVNIVPPVIPAQTVTVSRAGVAAIQIVCPADAGACRGTVRLVLVKSRTHRRARVVAAAASPKTDGTTLGSAKFMAKAGEKPFVQVRLNRRGRRRILRTRHTRCRVVVTTRTVTGKVVTTSRTIALRRGRSTKKR